MGSSRVVVQHRFGVRAIGATFHLKAIHHNVCTYCTVCSMAIAHILLVCLARAARRGPRKLVIGSTKSSHSAQLVRSFAR